MLIQTTDIELTKNLAKLATEVTDAEGPEPEKFTQRVHIERGAVYAEQSERVYDA